VRYSILGMNALPTHFASRAFKGYAVALGLTGPVEARMEPQRLIDRFLAVSMDTEAASIWAKLYGIKEHSASY